MCVWFEQPDPAVRIITQQLLIFVQPKVTSPNDSRTVDVGRVLDPLLESMLWPIAHENQLLPDGGRELVINVYAPLRIAMIDRIPGFKFRHRGIEFGIARSVESIPEKEMGRAEKQQNSSSQAAPLTKLLQSNHAHQNKQTSKGCNVVGIKVWIEIRSEAEQQDGKQDPCESA